MYNALFLEYRFILRTCEFTPSICPYDPDFVSNFTLKSCLPIFEDLYRVCYELGDGPRAYRSSIFSARTRLQLMCCATRRLLSSNFRRETDEGSGVRMVSLSDNQCRFQTEEHTWGSERISIKENIAG